MPSWDWVDFATLATVAVIGGVLRHYGLLPLSRRDKDRS